MDKLEVKSCCFCINLRVASYLIAGYTFVVGLCGFEKFAPGCSNVYKGETLAYFAKFSHYCYLIMGLFLIVGSIFLFYILIKERKINMFWYLDLMASRAFITFLARLFILINMGVQEFQCEEPCDVVSSLSPTAYYYIMFFGDGVLHSIVLIYFVIVVRSYTAGFQPPQ